MRATGRARTARHGRSGCPQSECGGSAGGRGLEEVVAMARSEQSGKQVGFVVRCACWQSRPFTSYAQAEQRRAAIESLGACAEAHEVVEVER